MPEETLLTLIAGADDTGRRLDRVIRKALPEIPLSLIFSSLRKGNIRVNGARAKPDYRICELDTIGIDLSGFEIKSSSSMPGKSPAADEELKLLSSILILATDDLLFLNKPKGVLAHGPNSIESMVQDSLKRRSSASLSFRPGPLHRLDRNTSGLIVFPRSSAGARVFSDILRNRRLGKNYLTVLDGEFGREESWTDILYRDTTKRLSHILPKFGNHTADSGEHEAREARCHVIPLARTVTKTLALVSLDTGLTHQIRTQASARRFPLSGDLKYGGLPQKGGYFLHALSIRFDEKPFPDTPALIYAPLNPAQLGTLTGIFGRDAVESAVKRALEA